MRHVSAILCVGLLLLTTANAHATSITIRDEFEGGFAASLSRSQWPTLTVSATTLDSNRIELADLLRSRRGLRFHEIDRIESVGPVSRPSVPQFLPRADFNTGGHAEL